MENQMKTTVENGNIIVFERLFNAPKDLVFKMFTDANHIKKWWAPNGFDIPVCEINFKEGGSWFYCMECTDKNLGDFFGTKNWAKAIYNEIKDKFFIKYTHYFTDENGDISPAVPAQELSLEFIETADGQTKLINKAVFENKEQLDNIAPMMTPGVEQSWLRLEAILADQK